MSNYLKHKPGSIEEVISKQTKLESGYQDKFKKELEKAGKGVGSMTPKEKSDFFNKLDKKHTAKDEEKKVEVKEEVSLDEGMPGGANSSSKKGSVWKAAKKKRFGVKVGQHEPKGDKLAEKAQDVAVGQRLKMEDLHSTIRNMWMKAGQNESYEDMVPSKKDDEKKEKPKKTTLTGEKATKIDTEPTIDYNK